MKKFLLFMFFIILLFILILLNCTGGRGNPLELVGTWEYKYDEKDDGGDETKFKNMINFYDNGSFSYKGVEEEKWVGGSKYEVECEGFYYGEPWNSPKSLTLEITKYKKEENGIKVDTDYDGSALSGDYYIKYTSPTRLFSRLGGAWAAINLDGVFIKK